MQAQRGVGVQGAGPSEVGDGVLQVARLEVEDGPVAEGRHEVKLQSQRVVEGGSAFARIPLVQGDQAPEAAEARLLRVDAQAGGHVGG